MNPLKLFFQDSALFLLRLLRHLVVQALILSFVALDHHVHKFFHEELRERPKVEQREKPKQPKPKCNKRNRASKRKRSSKQTLAQTEIRNATGQTTAPTPEVSQAPVASR